MGRSGMPYRVARAVGDFGEQVACDYLLAEGYVLLERNWRCERGELDVVARHGSCLVFCEVKTRRSQRFGSPVEGVTPAKAARLRRLATRWLAEHDQHAPQVRIDVIGVLCPPAGQPQVQHLQGVG